MTDAVDDASKDLGPEDGSASDQMLAVVTGLIHPTRLGWMFEKPIEYRLGDTRCLLSINHSQFNVFIEGDRPSDGPTFLNTVGAIVQGCLDSLGFFLATPLRAEILSMVIDGNTLVYREGRWPKLLPKETENYVPGEKLGPFVEAAINEPLIRLALADLRAAIDSPGDTVMLCFRAIESIRQWFLPEGATDSGTARKHSWDEMKYALGVEEAEVRVLEKQAIARRHGADSFASEDQRLNALILARGVVEQFVARRGSLAVPPRGDSG